MIAYSQISLQELFPEVFDKNYKKPVDNIPDRRYSIGRSERDKIIAVHDAIKLLADEDDDRAMERNGVGFNKFDTEFGHQLARQHTLSIKQMLCAVKMLKKYKKQIPDELYQFIYGEGEEVN